MKISQTEGAWDDYRYWQQNDIKKFDRINALVKDIQRHPFEGLGNPIPLIPHHSGYWSRRIDRIHRLVYKVKDNRVVFIQCRYHY